MKIILTMALFAVSLSGCGHSSNATTGDSSGVSAAQKQANSNRFFHSTFVKRKHTAY